jgi:hypothetical protein
MTEKKQTKLQRYNKSMEDAGLVYVRGWLTPEDAEKFRAMRQTKTNGNHLIKKGDKLALKVAHNL